jgi:fructokinase
MSHQRMLPRQRLVVAGEALIDRMTSHDGTVSQALGGSPFNLALALGRLGCRTSYRSPLSSDLYGRRLAELLDESSVTLAGGTVDRPTSLATVRLDAAGQADYSFQREGVADRALAPVSVLDDWAGDAGFFHVGSLALMPPDGQAWRELLAALRSRGVTTSVDANMRPMAAPDPAVYATCVKSVCAQADLLKVSDEDLVALGQRAESVKGARSMLGPVTETVLLTLGANGAWCLTREHEIFQPAPRVDLVDSVGAGDCFYAGFLASLDEQQALHRTASAGQLKQAMELGASCAAVNLGRAGCQPPWRHELPRV